MSNKIYLAVDGFRYEGFTNISISRSIENMSARFAFSTTVKEVDGIIENPIRVQDEVQVFIDEELVLTGVIEALSVNYNPENHTIQVSGRDKTGDLIDSSIIQKQYKERNFLKLIRQVLKDNGFEYIKVNSFLANDAILDVNETIRTEPGDTIFSFIDKYAQKLQIFMLTDESGNLVISSEGSEGAGGALISIKNGDNNNVISANLGIASNERFKFVEIYAQPVTSNFTKNSISQKGSAEDGDIINPRRKIILAGKATPKSILDKMADWNITVRKARGTRYDCQVAGYYTGRDNGLLWKINTVVQIKDDKCDLDGAFLIQGVEYVKSNQGSITNLSIVELGSFTIDPSKKFIYSSSKDNNKFLKKEESNILNSLI